jgi:hypothetical protein
MTDSKFEARVKASGLRPNPADMPMLEALVKDLDRAAAMLRSPRPYAQEPLNAFRLSPAQAAVPEPDATAGHPHGLPKIDLQAAGTGGGW